MRCTTSTFGFLIIFLLLGFTSTHADEVLFYTGTTSWFSSKAAADEQAQLCIDQLDALGIANSWAQSDTDSDAVADWVSAKTDNGELDVLVLYGSFPPTLYPPPNSMTDGSIAELFIESTDGDAIINHGDYMFYVSGTGTNNDAAGLQNMMDIPGITMWDDNTPVMVTPEGAQIAPSLTVFLTDRPFHTNELAGEWFVEVALAQNEAGTRADPIIVRDGDRGRLIPVIQTSSGNEPKGFVAAEIIAWLYGEDLPGPTDLGFSGPRVDHAGKALPYTVVLEDAVGARRPSEQAVTVNLSTDSASGAFDTAADGAFDGTMTSVTIAAAETTATVFYKDTNAGTATLSVVADGLEGAELELLLHPDIPNAPPGAVAIYTGTVNWITEALADEQAQICVDLLTDAGVEYQWFQSDADQDALAAWMEGATGNGELDVLVLYGVLPPSLYPNPNVMPDGSIAELFVESTDGDAIINHGDWMFYVAGVGDVNGAAGLQNIMDIPGITMSGNNEPMEVTPDGAEIAPTLGNYLTDRPLHLNELAGNWFVEAALAHSVDGAFADPIIVRDGNLGRLIPMYQAADQNDPKGAVAAEVIVWLMGQKLSPSQLELSGPPTTIEGKAFEVDLRLLDVAGYPRAPESDLAVDLATDSATGAFDTQEDGAFDGSVSSITVPAGTSSTVFYYRDTAAQTVLLTATANGLDAGEVSVKVLPFVAVTPGEVAIYTGTFGWISKEAADEQAQSAVDVLEAEGIPNVWYQSDLDGEDLAAWVQGATDNGQFDVLVLYGVLPPSLYPNPNVMPDGSVAELFIESTDGDAIINHADWMFYVSGVGDNNGAAGLQNIMDIPGINMGPDDTPVTVTPDGLEIAPSLEDFLSDRPLHVDELAGDWTVEVALAQDASGTRADPIIVRDGNHGRIVPVIQTNNGDEPKGEVAAEIITWMMEAFTSEPSAGPRFVRSDANSDGESNIVDATYILNYLFAGVGEPPVCLKSADVNDDGTVNISDPVDLLNYLFATGAAPAAPYPGCGVDPTEDSLPCETQPGCT